MSVEVLKNMMEKMGTAMAGIPIVIIELPNGDNIASSTLINGVGYIKFAFGMDLPGLTEDEKEIILLGLFAHELLHLLLSDFDYVGQTLMNYPERERKVRLYLANLVEDPAIEFFGDQYLTEYLMAALKQTISYFYKDSGLIQDDAPTAFVQLINALIQYGDIGVIKGNFTFPEARDAFIRILPIMNEAIENPDAKQRFSKAQEIYEIVRPLWEEHEKELLANKMLEDLMKKYGKNTISESGGALEKPQYDPYSQNAASERRKKTLHLVTKKQAEQLQKQMEEANNPDDATDIFLTIDDDMTENPPSKEDMGISESESTGADGKDKASDDVQKSDLSEKMQAGDAQEAVSSEPEDSLKKMESSIDTEEKRTGFDPSDSINLADTDKQETSFTELLGKEIEALSEELAKDLQLEISEEMVSALHSMVQAAIESMEKAEQRERKRANAEGLYVDVKSTYYPKQPKYSAYEAHTGNEREYAELCKSMKTHILNLKSELQKIFRSPHVKTEYRTTGHLDTGRVCGRKISARLFKKRTAPDDAEDLVIEIMLDASGSMNKKTVMVKQCCTLLQEAFSKFKVSFKVVDFTSCGGSDAQYKHYGSWKNTMDDRKSITGYETHGGTFLGHAIRYGGNLLKRRPEQHKIFIIITDGDPEYQLYKNRNDGMNDCRAAVKDIRKFAEVIGIGVYGDDTEREKFEFVFQDSFVSFKDMSTLVKELPKKIKKILRNY